MHTRQKLLGDFVVGLFALDFLRRYAEKKTNPGRKMTSVFLLVYYFLVAINTSVTAAQDSDCIALSKNETFEARCEDSDVQCGNETLADPTSWECFASHCAAGLGQTALVYRRENQTEILQSPWLCSTGREVFSLSVEFRWIFSNTTDQPKATLSVSLETDKDRQLLQRWNASENSSDVRHVSVQCEQCPFKLVLKASPPEAVQLLGITLRYSNTVNKPADTSGLYKFFITLLAVLAFNCVALTLVLIVFCSRNKRTQLAQGEMRSTDQQATVTSTQDLTENGGLHQEGSTTTGTVESDGGYYSGNGSAASAKRPEVSHSLSAHESSSSCSPQEAIYEEDESPYQRRILSDFCQHPGDVDDVAIYDDINELYETVPPPPPRPPAPKKAVWFT